MAYCICFNEIPAKNPSNFIGPVSGGFLNLDGSFRGFLKNYRDQNQAKIAQNVNHFSHMFIPT